MVSSGVSLGPASFPRAVTSSQRSSIARLWAVPLCHSLEEPDGLDTEDVSALRPGCDDIRMPR